MANKFEDELAVRALIAAYADAVNRRDPEGMAAVLAPGAVIEKPGYGDPVQGDERILRRYRRLQQDREFLCQMLHSGVVHVDGDRATSRFWFSETKLPVGKSEWIFMIGVYQDEAVRLPQGWRFSRRVQRTIMEQTVPSGPNIVTHSLPEMMTIPGLPSL